MAAIEAILRGSSRTANFVTAVPCRPGSRTTTPDTAESVPASNTAWPTSRPTKSCATTAVPAEPSRQPRPGSPTYTTSLWQADPGRHHGPRQHRITRHPLGQGLDDLGDGTAAARVERDLLAHVPARCRGAQIA